MTKHRAPRAAPDGPDDDGEARREFERAMTGVAPLVPDPRGRVRAGPRHSPRPLAPPQPAGAVAGKAEPPPDDFAAPGVDRREIRRLKRGEYRVDADLDLHGLSAIRARAAVEAFIERSRHARLRCVRIVHGRGLNSAGGVPVLRGEVRARLMTMPGVLAYAVAPAAAGGTGAVHVLLRR